MKKCFKCGKEVSIWASRCPYCLGNPGDIGSHIFIGFLKWTIILGAIFGLISHIFGINISNNETTSQVNKQPAETQVQSSQTISKTRTANYKNERNIENEKKNIEDFMY